MDDAGVAQPEEWFGLNPAEGEDSAEEIASSDEGEGEEGDDGEDAAPDGEATSPPQPDHASSNDAETRQPATPRAGTAVSTDQPGSPVAPLV